MKVFVAFGLLKLGTMILAIELMIWNPSLFTKLREKAPRAAKILIGFGAVVLIAAWEALRFALYGLAQESGISNAWTLAPAGTAMLYFVLFRREAARRRFAKKTDTS